MAEVPMLRVEGLGRRFGSRVDVFDAVRDVSFDLAAGGSLAIVGESGSGKTTTARIIVGLDEATAGTVRFDGRVLESRPNSRQRRDRARQTQIVFQNPYLSLDPRQTAREAVEEVLSFHFHAESARRTEQANELLDSVGLGPKEAGSRPSQLSGGQNQRVAIARALAARPRLLVLDEAVSALDVSVQAQILNLLQRLRRELDIGYLFISHNLAVVRQVCDHVLVMYRGTVVERGTVDEVLLAPRHPYTRKLIASIPGQGADWTPSIEPGNDLPDGCRFRDRCPLVHDACLQEPELLSVTSTQSSRCWLEADLPARIESAS